MSIEAATLLIEPDNQKKLIDSRKIYIIEI